MAFSDPLTVRDETLLKDGDLRKSRAGRRGGEVARTNGLRCWGFVGEVNKVRWMGRFPERRNISSMHSSGRPKSTHPIHKDELRRASFRHRPQT